MKITNISANGKVFNPAEIVIDLDKNPHIEVALKKIIQGVNANAQSSGSQKPGRVA